MKINYHGHVYPLQVNPLGGQIVPYRFQHLNGNLQHYGLMVRPDQQWQLIEIRNIQVRPELFRQNGDTLELVTPDGGVEHACSCAGS